MRKISYFLLLMISFTLIFNKNVSAAPSVPDLEADGVVLMDATTGKILYSKNSEKSLAPASTTKVMTALLVLRNSKLDEKVTITKSATAVDGTRIGLIEGEVFTVKDLLYGMLLLSANDCAEALAEHVSGSKDAFVELMNKTAKELGANNTTFVNPSGLYEDDHKTTAYDLSLIMREVSKNQTFIDISRTPAYEFPASNINGENHWADNKNELIMKNNRYFYQYALTGKCGYTTPSKHTYTAVAEKDGQRLVATFLYSSSKDNYFREAKNLFEYGFNNFSLVKLYSKGEKLSDYTFNDSTTMPLLASDDISYVCKKGDENSITKSLDIEKKDLSNLSFTRDQEVLSASVSVNGQKYQNIRLSAGESREIKPVQKSFSDKLKEMKPELAAGGVAAVFLGFALIRYRARIKKRKIKSRYSDIINKLD
ncbi:D-alanyl-D-alanine carboxypeptidase family protein [Clostridium sp. 'White wine YQ']|uniref:D-alanyl-D-alanine carboxypeptidase family protein n=1 Tax=Clostridium sp. 'White wine YQ' TaxID=3027474 RepID=UPI0023651696|nr:D-alanyl-D-alanine carboxypeptidase family protein [Clostridium sp. 'White wine YQ']MDD7794863.1 D-alanyl-D-alanine carboxypeptidase [Clostridium sp. 'White wine YQ']